MILVIGGTGFIGKTLLQHLHAEGRAALTVSRQPQRDFLDRQVPGIRALTPAALFDDPEPVLAPLTGCVHLASVSRLGDNRDTPWREAEQTLVPLMRLLHLLGRRPQGPLPFVYLSSAAIYGSRDAARLSEDMAPRPATAYGAGKAMAETAVQAAGRQAGFPTRILRASTPIGRWQAGRARGAVGILMDAAETGGTFRLNGDGSAVRDYFDARDLARAILAALSAGGPEHAIWNVGSGEGTSLRQLIGEVEAVTGRRIAVERRPMPAGEVARAVLDIGRIRRDLGWRPNVPLRDSLREIWDARGH